MTSRDGSLGDLASKRCLKNQRRADLKSLHLMDINRVGALVGAHSSGEIPVTIPNTEVKPSSADYTATAGN